MGYCSIRMRVDGYFEFPVIDPLVKKPTKFPCRACRCRTVVIHALPPPPPKFQTQSQLPNSNAKHRPSIPSLGPYPNLLVPPFSALIPSANIFFLPLPIISRWPARAPSINSVLATMPPVYFFVSLSAVVLLCFFCGFMMPLLGFLACACLWPPPVAFLAALALGTFCPAPWAIVWVWWWDGVGGGCGGFPGRGETGMGKYCFGGAADGRDYAGVDRFLGLESLGEAVHLGNPHLKLPLHHRAVKSLQHQVLSLRVPASP